MATVKIVELKGKSYSWDGKWWYNSDTYEIPPLVILHKLNKVLEQELEREDEQTTSPHNITDSDVPVGLLGFAGGFLMGGFGLLIGLGIAFEEDLGGLGIFALLVGGLVGGFVGSTVVTIVKGGSHGDIFQNYIAVLKAQRWDD